MAIRTHESLTGFIANDPELTSTRNGDARFYARIGVEHYRKEDDGSFTKLDNTFHHLVLYRRAAEHAYERFTKGDNFIASGRVREFDYTNSHGDQVAGDEFIATKIGHDSARTHYEVQRNAPSREVSSELERRNHVEAQDPQRTTPHIAYRQPVGPQL